MARRAGCGRCTAPRAATTHRCRPADRPEDHGTGQVEQARAHARRPTRSTLRRRGPPPPGLHAPPDARANATGRTQDREEPAPTYSGTTLTNRGGRTTTV